MQQASAEMKAYLYILTNYDGTFRAFVANNLRNAVARMESGERCVEYRRFDFGR